MAKSKQKKDDSVANKSVESSGPFSIPTDVNIVASDVAKQKPVVKVEPVGPYDDVRSKIALAIMIKNEEKRITVSFDTMKALADTFIIFDTGSTDRTIDVVKDYCEKNNIRLFLKQGGFVNFSVSRNELLDFADTVLVDSKGKPEKRYLMLLDCNDEVRNHDEIAKLVRNHKGTQTGFHLRQQWWTGHTLDTYFNIRMVISHNRWRYKDPVHEYIAKPDGTDTENIIKCDNIILYQDRTVDDDKSQKRFKRDKDLLYEEHVKNPHAPRILFYLAQTCSCLGLLTEAYQYYILRTKEAGFVEEQYHAYYRNGELSRTLGHPWEESLNWYLKAFAHSSRVEPLCRIAEYYCEYNYKGEKSPDWMLAWLYISTACKLMYPHNQILFVNRRDYLYTRWHLMGRIAFYVGRYKEGKEGCVRALMFETNELDENNLQFYLKQDQLNTMMVKTQQFQFKALLGLSVDQGELYPATEEGLGFPNVNTRDTVLKKAYTRLLKK